MIDLTKKILKISNNRLIKKALQCLALPLKTATEPALAHVIALPN